MFNVNRPIRTGLILFLLVLVCFAVVKPGLAQTATPTDPTAPVTLDDATPSIDVMITPINGASGVIRLELDGVHVRLSTATNVEIISIADSRIQSFAFQYASNAPSYVMRIERLPGVTTGRIKILPDTALPVAIAPASNGLLTTLSGTVSGLATVAPSVTLPVIVQGGANLFSAQVTSDSTIQLMDNAGITLFKVQAGTGIQAIQTKITPGLYLANFTNNDSNARQDVTVALADAPDPATATPTAAPTQNAISTRPPVLLATPTIRPPNTPAPIVRTPVAQPPVDPSNGSYDDGGEGGDH